MPKTVYFPQVAVRKFSNGGIIIKSIAGRTGILQREEVDSKPLVQKEDSVKIAIPLVNGRLAMHFGHCGEFALIEVNETEKKILEQKNVAAPDHEPGLLPRWLSEHGANVIIAGGMGSRAQTLFAENNIKVVTGAPADEPSKIVLDYLKGELVTGGNVCDH